MNRSRTTGAAGEDYAAKLLEQRGCTVLQRNYHSRYGEVDLIVRDGECICFVEVKTRKRNPMVSGPQSVTPAKQRKIIATALQYLQTYPTELQPRFDLLVVQRDQTGKVGEYDYITGAFDGEAYSEHL